MKAKDKRILKDYLIGWLIANLIWELLWNNSPNRTGEITIDFTPRIIVFFLTWLGYGTLFGMLHIFIERFLNGRVSFVRLLVSSLALQLAVAIIFLIVLYQVLIFFTLINFQKR